MLCGLSLLGCLAGDLNNLPLSFYYSVMEQPRCKIGVLALQGAFHEHASILSALGNETIEVKCSHNALERSEYGTQRSVFRGGSPMTHRHAKGEIHAFDLLFDLFDGLEAPALYLLRSCCSMMITSHTHIRNTRTGSLA